MAKCKKEMAQGFASGELWDVLSDLVDDLNNIKTLVNDLKTKYNAHTHTVDSTESTMPSETTSVTDVTLKTTK